MTVKEAIVARVEQLDEDQAQVLLDYIEQMLESGNRAQAFAEDEDEQPDALMSLIGVMGPGEPSDIAKYKDDYIADAIQSNWK
jgi:hypothetical protein